MTSSNPSELALIEQALVSIERALAQGNRNLPELPFFRPTEDSGWPEGDREPEDPAHEASYRAQPKESAILFCLMSASALLDVSRTLLTQPAQPSPEQHAAHWKALARHTKIAGRAAYRAALILADGQSGNN